MFYKYTIAYPNGTKLSGYAESEKTAREVRMGIEKRFFGNFTLILKKQGAEFPKCNSDYILTI